MTGSKDSSPDTDRAARRAKALRENRRRRKAAARKQADDGPTTVPKPGNSRD